jgi:four helix bundle protein
MGIEGQGLRVEGRSNDEVSGLGYRDLVAWQRAVDLVEHIYRISADWPASELYGLANQVRRAPVSVPANIAEGQGRSSPKEFAHHLSIAYGSLCEVETHLLIANRLTFIDLQTSNELIAQTTNVAKPLRGLMRSLQ